MKKLIWPLLTTALVGCSTYDDGLRMSADEYEKDYDIAEAHTAQQSRIDQRNLKTLETSLDVLNLVEYVAYGTRKDFRPYRHWRASCRY